MTQKPNRRRWLTFSLRAGLIVLTAGCVSLGYWIESARAQREAASALRDLGLSVQYDYEVGFLPDGNLPYYGMCGNALPASLPQPERTRVPEFLVNWFGVDFFHTVVYVDVGSGHRPDIATVLPLLQRLKGLRCVSYSWTNSKDDHTGDQLRTGLPKIKIHTFLAVVG